ncbi:MAG: hypothetical protein DRP25_04325, partial [Thermotoga sp.]
MRTALMILFLLIVFVAIAYSIDRVLIIVSGEFFDDNINPLRSVEEDEKKMKGIFDMLGIETEVLEHPTLGVMKARIRGFIEGIKEGEVGVIYYSGHGYIGKDGKFYLIPKDVDSKYIEDTSMEFGKVLDMVMRCKGKVMFILDACYSGVLKEGKPIVGVKIRKVEMEGVVKEGKGVFMMSSEGGEVSRGGVFTKWLVEGMKGEGDEDGDGWVELKELYEYVKERVEDETGGKQKPVLLAREDMRVVESIEGKVKRLINEVWDMYSSGKITKEEREKIFDVIAMWRKGKLRGDIEELIMGYMRGEVSERVLISAMKAYMFGGSKGEGKKEGEGIKEVGEVEGGMKEGKEGTCILKVYAENELARSGKVYLDGEYAGELKEGICVVEDIPKGRHE